MNAETDRRGLLQQIESRTHELKSMQDTFMMQLQSAQREIGILKQALLPPVPTGRVEQLAAQVSEIRAEIESKASTAAARINDTMTAAEETTRRIVETARADSGRLASK